MTRQIPMQKTLFKNWLKIIVALCLGFGVSTVFAAAIKVQPFAAEINQIIQPLMQKYQIPGMALAVTIKGKAYFFNYGLMSTATRKPVSEHTLFEVGSVTKTFTATLAADAFERHKIAWQDSVSRYLPQLATTAIAKMSLLNLATQTSGLPLSIPAQINTKAQLITYLKQWQLPYAIGSHRTYSNIGIGLLGMSVEAALGNDYAQLLSTIILKPLQMQHTYLEVPPAAQADYAQGYTAQGEPIRMATKMLLPEAYGIKSCSAVI